ncbi:MULTISPECIES: NnrU family protein [Janthinobacterium]|uniref:NnrU family protein n=1 Tax=Janthinobacterium TaxID=29580 RepID=UPI001C5B4B8F|nr:MULTISPECIES: NnrU family protein [Janthinobacterium]MBW3508815.1 NnrU family protein [Janthinobacterium sp. NKUCC06_STL]MCA1861735.1 NnrU family protein [Janthinobacterium lividum]
MTVLILGLLLFLGLHSVRILADGWRGAQLARLGEKRWKGLYSLVAFAGLGLIIWGYALARQQPQVLWTPPMGLRQATALLMLFSLILLAAANVPSNRIKTLVHHPMLLGTQLWAVAHLLANGNVADVLLFGGFLVWSLVDMYSAVRRDRAAGVAYPGGTMKGTLIAIVAGCALWLLLAFWLHGVLFDVRPFG